jgi:hypothetical protein
MYSHQARGEGSTAAGQCVEDAAFGLDAREIQSRCKGVATL